MESAKKLLGHAKFMNPEVFQSLNPEYERLQNQLELIQNSVPQEQITQLQAKLDFIFAKDDVVMINEVKSTVKTFSGLKNVPQEAKVEFLNKVLEWVAKGCGQKYWLG